MWATIVAIRVGTDFYFAAVASKGLMVKLCEPGCDIRRTRNVGANQGTRRSGLIEPDSSRDILSNEAGEGLDCNVATLL